MFDIEVIGRNNMIYKLIFLKMWLSLDGSSLKGSRKYADGLYELDLLAFVLNKFDFWFPKCPNHENIQYIRVHILRHNNQRCAR